MKVVLFTILWSALAYETLKLLRFEPMNIEYFGDWGDFDFGDWGHFGDWGQ